MRKKLSCILLSVFLCTGLVLSDFTILNPAESGNAHVEEAEAASKLKTPSVSVKASGYESIKVSWNKVSNAQKYKVYRATSKNGTYKRVITTSKNYYYDKNASQNRYYYYKVAATGRTSSAESYKSPAKSGRIKTTVSLSSLPAYKGKPWVAVNKNVPEFRKKDLKTTAYEKYSPLDTRGRCRAAVAIIDESLMPTEERGSIGMVKPTGWKTVKYDCVPGKYLYNRCHLIGYQLTGENANERNLITGTRYLNVEGMLPFENMVTDYIKETGNHVMYRVTPIFNGSDLLARGVQMEAKSIEDKGEGIEFNVFVYNVQPGVKLYYSNGNSSAKGGSINNNKGDTVKPGPSASGRYVLNLNTKKFHKPDCSSVKRMSESNKKYYNGKRSDLIKQGYEPCKNCNP